MPECIRGLEELRQVAERVANSVHHSSNKLTTAEVILRALKDERAVTLRLVEDVVVKWSLGNEARIKAIRRELTELVL